MHTDPAAAPAPTGAAATPQPEEARYTIDHLLMAYLWGREDERRRLAGDWAEIQQHWPDIGEDERRARTARRFAEMFGELPDRPLYRGGPTPWEGDT